MIAGCTECGEDLRVIIKDDEVLLACACTETLAQTFIDAHEDGEMNYVEAEDEGDASSTENGSDQKDRMFQ